MDATHPVHDAIAGEVDLPAGGVVVDLGCGRGATLAAIARRRPGLRLIGLDDQHRHLVAAGPGPHLVRADLARPLPLVAGCADGVVCHNLLELLPDPDGLLLEAARILRGGGQAIFSHTDFEGIVLGTSDVELSRRICHAYADVKQAWMRQVDGRMARKLAGLVRRSPLSLDRVVPHALISTRLSDPWHRVDEITAAVRRSGTVGAGELEAWRADLAAADERGDFFYAETTFIAVARQSFSSPARSS